MALNVRELSRAVGVEVLACNLTGDLAPGDFADIEALFDNQLLLLFRNQQLDRKDGRALFARFGPLIDGLEYVTNEAATGRGALEFHSEQSFQRTKPIRGLALYCEDFEVTAGATLFINCVAAYQALPDDLKARLAELDMLHTWDPRARLGTDYKGQVPDGGWRAIHPAILEHPITGIPILYVSPWFTTAVAGMDTTASSALLSRLFDFISEPRFLYRHEWKPNDLVLWDNFGLIHAREPFDDSRSRVLRKYEFGLPAVYRLPDPHRPTA